MVATCALALADASVSPASAQTVQDSTICKDQGLPARRRLDACTAAMKAGRLSDAILADLYVARGTVYRELGNLESAIADYDHAVDLNPSGLLGYLARGNANRIRKKYDEAISDYRQAAKLDPKVGGPYVGMGNVYLEQGEPDLAIAKYAEAIRLEPKYAVAYRNRARRGRRKTPWRPAWRAGSRRAPSRR
jgi:tetratricopeptide (TPR) repeat protein